jgi:hypothetical protein
LEQRFHDYFYNGEIKLRLSDLTAVWQKHSESAGDYPRWFRETRNKCYNLTIRERDLIDLAFAGLALYLREKMEGQGQELLDVNQLMKKVMVYENQARDQR